MEFPSQKEHFSLKYDSSFLKEGQTEIETCFFEKLKSSRKSDFMVGYTTVGPHRDDISFYINEFRKVFRIRKVSSAL